jgi:hypothetical protein
MGTPALLVAALLWFAPQLQTNTPFPHGSLRNSFVTGAETLIDSADAIDLHASEDRYGPELAHVKSIYAQLQSMAQDEREKDVASALNDMIFAISACHIQAVGGNSTTQCEAQVAHARRRSMETLSKHRTPNGWEDGPPDAR